MMQRITLLSQIKQGPRKLLHRLNQYDLRRPYVKYLIALVLIGIYTLFMGNETIFDWEVTTTRKQYLQGEYDRLKPLLEQDSLRLERIKARGVEVEHTARERYLMKAPGEKIYIVSPSQDEH